MASEDRTLKLQDHMLKNGHPPDDLQPDEVPSLLRALDARVGRASAQNVAAIRYQTRLLRRATTPPPFPAPTKAAS